MTVFVLAAGEYEDFHIVSVHRTEAGAFAELERLKAAEPHPQWAGRWHSADIEEWPVKP